MASINDVFDALNDIKGKLDQVHADELTTHGKLDTVNTRLTTLNQTVSGVGTAINSRLDALVNGQKLANELALHETKQNETIICALEHISRNTCELVTIADIELRAAQATSASVRVLAEIAERVHADAALDLERLDAIEAKVADCCPPEEVPPRCSYEPCKNPGPFKERKG
jgi:hypothetical protein